MCFSIFCVQLALEGTYTFMIYTYTYSSMLCYVTYIRNRDLCIFCYDIHILLQA